MRTMIAACLLAVTAQAQTKAPAEIEPKVIYGSDDRRDLYQVQDAKVLSLADSTLALFEGGNVAVNGDWAALTTEHYGVSYGLCKEEPFYDQRAGAFCSGSLVAPDVIMTAGHCVPSADACKAVKFVFGFALKKEGAHPASVPASEVYGCSELLGREQIGTGQDWALVKLDRTVTGHAPLKVNLETPVANGDPLFVIGHPAGLPTKIAGGASVREAIPKDPESEQLLSGFFRANLDTYGGNSGSAVFNAKTGLVEGILVRGEMDYTWKGDCRVSNACSNEGCRGEDVTKASSVGFPGRAPTPAPARLVGVGKGLAALLEQAQALQTQ